MLSSEVGWQSLLALHYAKGGGKVKLTAYFTEQGLAWQLMFSQIAVQLMARSDLRMLASDSLRLTKQIA